MDVIYRCLYSTKKQSKVILFSVAMESQSITLFPTIKKRRQSVIANTIAIDVYCYYRCPDDGSKVVLCDGTCGQWYHLNCLKQLR